MENKNKYIQDIINNIPLPDNTGYDENPKLTEFLTLIQTAITNNIFEINDEFLGSDWYEVHELAKPLLKTRGWTIERKIYGTYNDSYHRTFIKKI